MIKMDKTIRISRRGYIKIMGVTGTLVLNSQLPIKIPRAKASPSSTRYAMVIDTTKCIGCRNCVYGCINENKISIGGRWIESFEMEFGAPLHPPYRNVFRGTPEIKEGERWFLLTQCMHCDNPPCVKVCPTKATYKDENGLVVVDYDKCIGCRYCMAACPYNVRVFNWSAPDIPADRREPFVSSQIVDGNVRPSTSDVSPRDVGVVEKCTFCSHRTTKGLLPACVIACPVRARTFGDLNDPNSEVSKLVRSGRCIRLLEELGTDPQLYYLR